MSIHLSIDGNDMDEAIAEFAKLAKAMNFFPQAEALQYAQGIAAEMCRQAGVPVPGAEPAGDVVKAAPAEQTTTEAEIIPPVDKPKRTTKETKVSEKAKAAIIESQDKTVALLDNSQLPNDPLPDSMLGETKALDHDDARAALRALAAAKDMPTCSALLKEFGAAKAMEVPVDKIAAFVAKAAELAAA